MNKKSQTEHINNRIPVDLLASVEVYRAEREAKAGLPVSRNRAIEELLRAGLRQVDAVATQ